jgi:hypothetical protein
VLVWLRAHPSCEIIHLRQRSGASAITSVNEDITIGKREHPLVKAVGVRNADKSHFPSFFIASLTSLFSWIM